MTANPYSIALLAGGESKRMGRDKRWIPWGDSSLLMTVAAELEKLGKPMGLIAKQADRRLQRPGWQLVLDRDQPSCAMSGVGAALRWAPTDWVFLSTCDQPFLLSEWVAELATRIDDRYEWILPVDDDRPQTLFSFMHRRSRPALAACWESRQYRLTDICNTIRTKKVDATNWPLIAQQRLLFFNINDRSDLQEAKRLAQEIGGRR